MPHKLLLMIDEGINQIMLMNIDSAVSETELQGTSVQQRMLTSFCWHSSSVSHSMLAGHFGLLVKAMEATMCQIYPVR